MNYDCVIEGAGAKICAEVGAYEALTLRGFTSSHIAGTSAGAIVGSCMAAGYEPEPLKKIIFEKNFTDFLDGSRWKVKRWWDIYRGKSMHSGDTFYEFIKDLLADKGVHTFKDLLTTDTKELDDPRYRWRLKVVISDVSMGRMLTLPNDARLFHMNPDDFEVARAVRMSMSIPGYFKPEMLKDSYIVDGGILSNFPIWIFDSDGKPSWPTFGILLVAAMVDLNRRSTRARIGIQAPVCLFVDYHSCVAL